MLRVAVLLPSPGVASFSVTSRAATGIAFEAHDELRKWSVSAPQGAEVDVCAEVGEARGVQRVHEAVLGNAPACNSTRRGQLVGHSPFLRRYTLHKHAKAGRLQVWDSCPAGSQCVFDSAPS
jgi:hypothetical protein